RGDRPLGAGDRLRARAGARPARAAVRPEVAPRARVTWNPLPSGERAKGGRSPPVIVPIALPFLILLFLLLLGVLVFLIEIRVLAYAYRKIGVRPRYVFALLVLSLVGGHVNIPLYETAVRHIEPQGEVTFFGRTYVVPPAIHQRSTVVAINIGGALIP